MGPTLEKQQRCGQEKQTPWDFPTTSVRGDKDALESLGLWKAGLLSLFMETIQGWGGCCVYLKTVSPCHTANFNPIGNHTNCLHPTLRCSTHYPNSAAAKSRGYFTRKQMNWASAPRARLRAASYWTSEWPFPARHKSRLWVRSYGAHSVWPHSNGSESDHNGQQRWRPPEMLQACTGSLLLQGL